MLTKKQVLEAIEAMPEEKFMHIEAVIEELILLEKIERGLDELRQEIILTEEEVNKEIDKW
jgi:hypothetical protein